MKITKILLNSKKKKKGNNAKKPKANLAAEKVHGPIKSIPVSCAIKAVPQIKVVIRAQINDADLFILI